MKFTEMGKMKWIRNKYDQIEIKLTKNNKIIIIRIIIVFTIQIKIIRIIIVFTIQIIIVFTIQTIIVFIYNSQVLENQLKVTIKVW